MHIRETVGSACMIFLTFLLAGRAIRHRNDWAALLLLDQRYSTHSVRDKLPKWLGGEKLVVPGSFGGVVKEMGGFFRERGKQT